MLWALGQEVVATQGQATLTAQEGLQVAPACEVGGDVHQLSGGAHGYVQPEEALVPQALEPLDLPGQVSKLQVQCRGH